MYVQGGPLSSCAQTFSLPSSCHPNIGAPRATAPLQLSTDALIHMHPFSFPLPQAVQESPLVPEQAPHALTLRDRRVVSQPELALRHTHAPRSLHLLTGWFDLIFTHDHTLARTPAVAPVAGTTNSHTHTCTWMRAPTGK